MNRSNLEQRSVRWKQCTAGLTTDLGISTFSDHRCGLFHLRGARLWNSSSVERVTWMRNEMLTILQTGVDVQLVGIVLCRFDHVQIEECG